MARLKPQGTRRRSQGAVSGPVRAALIERFRALADHYGDRNLPDFPEPYSRIVQRLEAGEIMRFPAWQVPAAPWGHRTGWVELTAADEVIVVDGPHR